MKEIIGENKYCVFHQKNDSVRKMSHHIKMSNKHVRFQFSITHLYFVIYKFSQRPNVKVFDIILVE